MTRGALLRWRQRARARAAALAALAPLPPSAVALAAAPRRAADDDEAAAEAAAEAEAFKTAAEKELDFASPGLFAKADPERMRLATAAGTANSAATSAAALPSGGHLHEAPKEECSAVITPPFLREARAAAVRAARSEAMRGGLGGLVRGDNQRTRAAVGLRLVGHVRPEGPEAAREAPSASQDAPPAPAAPAPPPAPPPVPVELSGLARAVARAEARAASGVTSRASEATASMRHLWRRW